jgi:hypothetical protein
MYRAKFLVVQNKFEISIKSKKTLDLLKTTFIFQIILEEVFLHIPPPTWNSVEKVYRRFKNKEKL